jgi:large subunit ribosomal protein L9
MEVILLERIEKLGQMGDVVTVKPGFARNYLLPQRKALRATKENIAYFEGQRAQLEAQNLKRKQEAEAVAKKIDGMSVTLIRQAGESGQLYGSVSARDIADAVTEAGASVERSQVALDRAIKVLGLHPMTIRLHPEVTVTVTANVARSQSEAETQAEAGRVVTEEEQQAELEAAEEQQEQVLEEIFAEEETGEEEETAEAAEETAVEETSGEEADKGEPSEEDAEKQKG